MDKCENCNYWKAHQIAIDDETLDAETGHCHRFPPQGDIYDLERFVSTHQSDWCGEFKKKKCNSVD